MPSLRAAISAVLVAAADGAGGLTERRMLFPQGYLPLPDAPADGTEGAPFDLSVRLNMIPGAGPVFTSSTTFVWDVYREILTTRILPAATTNHGYAAQFAAAQAQFGDGALTLSEFDYYPVQLLPAAISSATGWTPLALGPEQIGDLVPRLPAATRDWLGRFNLLDQLGDGLVSSVSLEVLPVGVVRRWLDRDVFDWEFFDLAGDPVSDGTDPRVGRLPAFVTEVLAVRNLVVVLGDAELPIANVVYRLSPGSAEPADPLAVLTELAARTTMAAVTVTANPGPTPSGAVALVPASADANSPGYLRFHVPIRFETAAAISGAQARLATASAVRAAKEAEGAQTIVIRDHRRAQVAADVGIRFGPLQAHNVRLEAGHEPDDQALEHVTTRLERNPELAAEIEAARAAEERLRVPVDTLTKLAVLPVDPGPHALALSCTVVPACPRPDPALFPVTVPAAGEL